MKFFTNMKVKTKLILLLSITLVGFIVTGVTYLNILQEEKRSDIAVQKLGQYHLDLENIVLLLGETVTHQRDFLLNKSSEDLAAFQDALSRTRDNLTGLRKHVDNLELNDSISFIQEALDEYQNSVSQLAETYNTLGFNAESGLIKDMRSSFQELEENLSLLKEKTVLGPQALISERLISTLLKIQRHESKYLQEVGSSIESSLILEFSNFIELLEQSIFTTEEKSQLGQMLFTYHDHLNRAIEILQNIELNREEVDIAFDSIGPAVDATVDTIGTLTTQNFNNLTTQRNRSTRVFILTFMGAAALMTLMMLFIGRSITNPLRRLQGIVQQVNQGDMNARANLQQHDEIGALANAFDNLLNDRLAQLAETERERAVRLAEAQQENEMLNNSVVELLQAVAQLSQRDLTVHVPVSEDVTGPVADALNLLTQETAKVLTEVTTISNEVATASRSVKTQSDVVVELADTEREQVSQTSNELAAAAEAMNKIATLAQNCNTTAQQAIERTQTALETVTNTVTGINATRDTIRETEKRIKRLGERSQEISGAVNLINNIAERTHILALNASMHAASAGEAGRGFAVVADEVQRLAENARQATEQIASLVGNIQIETMDTVTTMNTVITQVVEGSRLAEQAGEQMRETQQTTAELGESVRQIAEGSQSQAMISNELRNRAGQIVQSTLQTNQQLEAQGEQTARLLSFSSRLVDAVNVFRLPGYQAMQEDGAPTATSPTGDASETAEEREDWEVMVQS